MTGLYGKGLLIDNMEATLTIEHACNADDHETIRSLLGSCDSSDQKKETFIKVIECYENRSLFPMGYVFLFAKWLLLKREYKTAMEYLQKCGQNGAAEERIAQVIFENVIKPEESFYREKFNRNLELLQKNNVLFSNQVFDFEQIKKQVMVIANCLPPVTEDIKTELFNKDKTFLMIDITDMETQVELLDNLDFAYLVYSDLHLLYYMLLFEDYSVLSSYIEQRKLIIFDGTDEANLTGFFMDFLVRVPDNVFGMEGIDRYNETLNEINKSRKHKIFSLIEQTDAFYKNLDHEYYMELFKKDPSIIKILLIASEITDINKFIVKNWHQAFLELGYQAKLLIETKPYEIVITLSVYESIHKFKPDIVFNINWPVSSVLHGGKDCKNVLWIMRYRDCVNNPLNHAQPDHKCEYNNMFILPMYFEWEKKLKEIGVPENRIFNTFDGIDINVFTKKDEINGRYACDIVSVNNGVGNEDSKIDYYINALEDENLKKKILEVLDELKEILHDETVIFYLHDINNLMERLNEKMVSSRSYLRESGRIHIENFFTHIMDSLCRGRIMEWIIDSGITKNIKLWGTGWKNIEKFKQFHMGVARHGEELSTIYRNSKISISDTQSSLHERNFEIMAAGGFPLIRYVEIPGSEDAREINDYFKEDEEIVLFYSRDDLLNKIRYYLDNHEERERIAGNGRNLVIRDYSTVAIAKRTMDFIEKYYEK